MDIQVLNEIANLARQASLSKVSASVSANAQLKGLKGNPVPAPESPVPPPVEGSPEQTQTPVTPEISSVARAASAYSAAVGDGLNSDELSAIQDLAGRVRTAVSDFLSQPGLEQAENAATVVASNPEAIQDLTASVEQAVVATLNLPATEGEVTVNAAPPNEDVLEEVSAPERFISVERITNGAEPNNPVQVVAASPALENTQADGNARVETPVSRPEAVASSQQEPVTRPETVVTNSQETPVTAASPAVQNAQASDHARVGTPVSLSDAVAAPQQEPVTRPETVATNPQETPVIAASPALVNSRASENTSVENPVTVEEGVETSNRDFSVTAASPAVQNAQVSERGPVETPVSRPDAVTSSQQEPVTHPETVTTNPQEVPVVVASPALQNANAQSRVAENLVNATDTPETSNRDFRVTPASPALQNANAQSRVAENLVNATDTPETSNGGFAVTAASPALENAQAQNAEVGNPVNIPAPSVNQGQGLEGVQAQPVNPEGAIASPQGASSQTAPDQSNSQAASGQSNPQPASVPQPGPAQTSDLFAQDNAAVNPENIRNVNELVNSVVDNEFTSEAKKIFSQPKMIRTVADLADFILERLREIIAANQLQEQNQSSGEIGLS
ncbi:MAG: hypothetical protein V3R14_05590 [Nitrospinaceae bacterium]